MTLSLFQYFVAGVLGMLLHIFAVKYPSLRTKNRTANQDYTFGQYLKEDWSALVSDVVVVLLLTWGVRELLNLKPELEKYITWVFAFVGFTGSSIMLAIFSVANKKFLNMIDEKTNKADGLPPPDKK